MTGNAARPMAWADRGACRGDDQDLFFPPPWRGEISAADVDRVRPICQACPVFVECHTWALTRETEGIWAATSPKDRRRLRRALSIAAPPELDLATPVEPPPTVESLTAEGFSTSFIADQLGIDPRTVSRRRAQGRKSA